MFGDRMFMGDGAMIRLQCAHRYSAGEMRCLNCGEIYQATNTTMQQGIAVEDHEFEFTSEELDWL